MNDLTNAELKGVLYDIKNGTDHGSFPREGGKELRWSLLTDII